MDYLAPKLAQKGTKDSSCAAQLLRGRLFAEHKRRAAPAAAEPAEQPGVPVTAETLLFGTAPGLRSHAARAVQLEQDNQTI